MKKSTNSEDKLSTEEKLQNAINELSLQSEVMNKRAQELVAANKLRFFESNEKAARAEELIIANRELAFQNEEKHKRAEELLLANQELTYQNQEKEKRASELIIANKELAFQNEEKHKRAAELLVANQELIYQNQEKEKRAAELLVANKELAFQKEEKHKRAEELELANKMLANLNTEQQALFASIVNSSHDAMLSKTRDGIITSWNYGAEKIFGYTAEEMRGKHISILIPSHLQHETLEILTKIRNGKTVEHYETERTRKDGTIFKASLTISPIMDWKGNIIGASKILRDISERKKAQAELIKSSRMYALISAINQMIVKTTDEASLFNQACNIAVEIGKFKMAWIGMIDEPTKKLIPVAHAGADDDYLSKMAFISIEDVPTGRGPTGQTVREDQYVVCNDIDKDSDMAPWKEDAGLRGYMSSIAFPIRKFGKVVGAYSLYAGVKNFFDDTEIALLMEAAGDISFALENLEKAKLHQKAEEKLKENYVLQHIAGEIAKLGGWYLKLEENHVYWSDEVAKLHEMPPGYAPSVEEAYEFYAPEWREKMREVLTNCLQKGIPYDEHMEIFTASAKRIWVRTIGEAVRDTKGKIVKVQGAFQDVTERKKITTDLIQRNQELEQFTYIISHNLRAPVANIKGLLQWQGDKSLSKEDTERVANGLSSSINKLDTVIIDLSHILQLKNGISGAKERVVFAELVHSIKGSISTMILQDDCKIVAQFDEAPEMVTLKSYIYSIFYNLINNSLKYQRPDVPPVIDITSKAKNDKIELTFKDNGRGIDMKRNGSHVFGLYKRFHREIEGKGMGLFMVKTQVEALGGKISIQSEVNKGTEFTIVFANEKKHEN